MNKIFTKNLFFFALFNLVAFSALAQTITIGNIDAGPYAPGSTISVPIQLTGSCINPANTYNLYLSNASGSFASQKLIGKFTGNYATFVNGIIPAGTGTGSGYLVKVAATNPAVTSGASAAFSIIAGTGTVAALNSQSIDANYPEVFGSCSGASNSSYNFINTSTTGATVTASFYNELSQVTEALNVDFTNNGNFTAKTANYTVSVKATAGGIVGTYAYTLVNNLVNNSFGVEGSTTACLGSGATNLTYNIDPNVIKNNYPGLLYNVSWGDGTASVSYTYCQVLAAGGKVSHEYVKASCGNIVKGQNNSFEVKLQLVSPFCGNVGTPVASYAKVIAPPINLPVVPVAACVNTAVKFVNNSFPGDDPNSTSTTCSNSKARYTWLVDGVTKQVNYKLSDAFLYTFTTTGTHTVTLQLQNNTGSCAVADVTQDICIQEPPVPAFSLPVNSGCIPLAVTPVNTSKIDSNCNNTNKYVWTVTGPTPVAYANGTNANSQTPQFLFNKTGVYTIKLAISTVSCGLITDATVQTVVIDDTPTATLSKDTVFCGTNTTLKFDNTNNSATRVTFSGSAQNTGATYKWTVAGGAFTFVNNTSDVSQYPVIKFNDFARYTVSVTNTNVCGAPASSSQQLEFIAAPTVTAGTYPAVCAGTPVNLNGTSNNTSIKMRWAGGTGTFSDPNLAQTVYTPSAAEIKAGKVTLVFQGITTLAAPCDTITDPTTIIINKADSITSKNTVTSCAGKPLSYNITAAKPTTTFTWVVDASKTSATAGGYTVNGSGSFINDVLTNSDLNDNATVTYNIISTSQGCVSGVFVLTVTIPPAIATPSFTKDNSTACGNLLVQFTNTSKPLNSVFLWDFGDGSTDTGINPQHTFLAKTDGRDTVYHISLSIVSNCNIAPPYLDSVKISPQKPVARLIPDRVEGCSPFIVTGKNSSPGKNLQYTYYLYDGPLLLESKVYTDKSDFKFDTPLNTTRTKQYTIFMIAQDYCGNTDTTLKRTITVSAPTITPDMFFLNNKNSGCAPLNLTFVNNSSGGDTFYYTIYDDKYAVVTNVAAGTDNLPYVFTKPGLYYITITASSKCSSGVESSKSTNRVMVYDIPKAGFAASDTTGCRNVTASFTNTTYADPNTQPVALSYTWYYGDGATATGFTPPPHTYSFKNSPYTVKLVAVNPLTGCADSLVKKDYIKVTSPPGTVFTASPDTITSIPNYQFQFVDQTTGSPANWAWDFGDGTLSARPNPSHTYADTGKYKVTLITSTKDFCDSAATHYVRITGIPGELYLPNAFMPTSGTTELRRFAAKGSGIKQWHLQIFNGFGQLIWETTKLSAPKGTPIDGDGWDGTFKGVPVEQGVYVWQASATFINGSEWKGMSYNNSLPKRTGVVHLIR